VLITPTSSRPESEPAAFRSAASTSAPGIASSAMRAHDDRCSLDSSAARSAADAAVPWTASFLQAAAFSASAAVERSTASDSCSFGEGSAANAAVARAMTARKTAADSVPRSPGFRRGLL
jgi:hypothetical protein